MKKTKKKVTRKKKSVPAPKFVAPKFAIEEMKDYREKKFASPAIKPRASFHFSPLPEYSFPIRPPVKPTKLKWTDKVKKFLGLPYSYRPIGIELREAAAKVLEERIARKISCRHRRDDNSLNIKWHQHSGGIVMGVCGQCFSQFDTRNEADAELLRQDPELTKIWGKLVNIR